MKLHARLARLEAGSSPPSREHVIVSYESETQDEAVDLYGRDKIGPNDTVLRVVLWGERRPRAAYLEEIA